MHGHGLFTFLTHTATALGVGMCASTGARGGEAHAAASLLRSQGWQECPEKPGLASGLTAGSSTHRVPAHSTSAVVCRWPAHSQCCCPSRAHRPGKALRGSVVQEGGQSIRMPCKPRNALRTRFLEILRNTAKFFRAS